MNKKLHIATSLIILIAIFYGGYVLGQNKIKNDLINRISNINQASKSIDNAAFSINIPDGWMEQPSISGVSATIVKDIEDHEEVELKNINFKSYFMITYDEMKSRIMPDYVGYIKEQVIKSIPDFVVDKEEPLQVNGNEGYSIEGHERQQGADFKSLLVLVRGKDDGIWLISFNTAQKDWEKYLETAKETVNSFVVK
ncbi:MAG: hypothetical protein PHD31_00235 [Candidatus Pacebacteria bacterium]|nr:hypothetical protein [Candidatus Paceibacterota bacterium]